MRLLASLFLILTIAFGFPAVDAFAGHAAKHLYPTGKILRVRVSPDGEWIVGTVINNNTTAIMAQRFGSGEISIVKTSTQSIHSIDWIGRDTLLVVFGRGSDRQLLRVNFKRIDHGGFEFDTRWFKASGQLVHPLSLVDNVVVWEFDHRGENSVHHVGIDDLIKLGRNTDRNRRSLRIGKKVASIKGTSHRWIVDKAGYPIVANRRDETGYTILYRSTNSAGFEEIASYEDESVDIINPVGLTADGKNLLVFAYHGQDTLGLFEFDPRSKTFEREVYRRDDADLTYAQIDSITREIFSVTYEVAGQTRYHYLKAARSRYADKLGPDDPPIDTIHVVSSTTNRERFIYWSGGATEPGAHYLRSAPTNETFLVGKTGATLNRKSLAPTEAFHVTSEDGTVVEAFLTRPLAPIVTPSPLLVMPHGGPIGVRDSQVFDPVLQYLASWGFAVLQVNYRGSSGYGRAFESAGKKQWAQGIEDDIDAATEHAMALSEIDGDNVCIIGGSYGGFSAIVSVIRHPTRYRCAVTINGASDIPLLAESSDFADSKRVLAAFEENTGDLETEREKLLAISPAYNLRDVETPILVVFGDKDRRVDQDHAHRVITMLWLYGKEYEEVRVDGGAHSFNRDQWIDTLPRIRKYLMKYLMPGEVYEGDPHKRWFPKVGGGGESR